MLFSTTNTPNNDFLIMPYGGISVGIPPDIIMIVGIISYARFI